MLQNCPVGKLLFLPSFGIHCLGEFWDLKLQFLGRYPKFTENLSYEAQSDYGSDT